MNRTNGNGDSCVSIIGAEFLLTKCAALPDRAATPRPIPRISLLPPSPQSPPPPRVAPRSRSPDACPAAPETAPTADCTFRVSPVRRRPTGPQVNVASSHARRARAKSRSSLTLLRYSARYSMYVSVNNHFSKATKELSHALLLADSEPLGPRIIAGSVVGLIRRDGSPPFVLPRPAADQPAIIRACPRLRPMGDVLLRRM